jgi:hypothetical protein
VSQKLLYVDSPVLEGHSHDQSVAVAFDVEDGQHTDHVGGRIGLADIFKVAPFRRARRVEPVLDSNCGIEMLSCFCKQVALADDVRN